MNKDIQIHPIPALEDNYIWAIINTAHHKTSIVDPGEAEPVIAFLSENNLSLQSILITHHHWDHTHGVTQLIEKYQVPLYGSVHSKNEAVSHPLNDGDHVSRELCPLNLQGLSIPGHTLDHMAYYAPGFLFSGDTLFSAGCGRLFEGTATQMYNSLLKLSDLPDDTQVYCGHEYTLKNLHFAELAEPTNCVIQERIREIKELIDKGQPTLPSSMSIEKKTNPFLRCEMPHLVAQVEKYAGKRLTKPLEVFTWLRKWKDEFKLTV